MIRACLLSSLSCALAAAGVSASCGAEGDEVCSVAEESGQPGAAMLQARSNILSSSVNAGSTIALDTSSNSQAAANLVETYRGEATAGADAAVAEAAAEAAMAAAERTKIASQAAAYLKVKARRMEYQAHMNDLENAMAMVNRSQYPANSELENMMQAFADHQASSQDKCPSLLLEAKHQLNIIHEHIHELAIEINITEQSLVTEHVQIETSYDLINNTHAWKVEEELKCKAKKEENWKMYWILKAELLEMHQIANPSYQSYDYSAWALKHDFSAKTHTIVSTSSFAASSTSTSSSTSTGTGGTTTGYGHSTGMGYGHGTTGIGYGTTGYGASGLGASGYGASGYGASGLGASGYGGLGYGAGTGYGAATGYGTATGFASASGYGQGTTGFISGYTGLAQSDNTVYSKEAAPSQHASLLQAEAEAEADPVDAVAAQDPARVAKARAMVQQTKQLAQELSACMAEAKPTAGKVSLLEESAPESTDSASRSSTTGAALKQNAERNQQGYSSGYMSGTTQGYSSGYAYSSGGIGSGGFGYGSTGHSTGIGASGYGHSTGMGASGYGHSTGIGASGYGHSTGIGASGYGHSTGIGASGYGGMGYGHSTGIGATGYGHGSASSTSGFSATASSSSTTTGQTFHSASSFHSSIKATHSSFHSSLYKYTTSTTGNYGTSEECQWQKQMLQVVYIRAYIELTRLLAQYEVVIHEHTCEDWVMETEGQQEKVLEAKVVKMTKVVSSFQHKMEAYYVRLQGMYKLEVHMRSHITALVKRCGEMDATVSSLDKVRDAIMIMGVCPGLGALTFNIPRFTGQVLSQDYDTLTLTDAEVDAAMNKICADEDSSRPDWASGYTGIPGIEISYIFRAAETSEIMLKSVTEIPATNTATVPLAGTCPNCEGDEDDPLGPQHASGHYRVCWDPEAELSGTAKRTDCTAGKKAVLCVAEQTYNVNMTWSWNHSFHSHFHTSFHTNYLR